MCLEILVCDLVILSQSYSLTGPASLPDRHTSQSLLLWPLSLLPTLIPPKRPQALALSLPLSSSLSPCLTVTVLLGSTRVPCDQVPGSPAWSGNLREHRFLAAAYKVPSCHPSFILSPECICCNYIFN